MFEQLLERLGLDPAEVKTYIILLDQGPMPASVLAKQCGIIRASQYVLLKRLLEKGFATQSIKQGIKIFGAEKPEKITLLYQEKQKQLQRDYDLFNKLLPELASKQSSKLLVPKFQLFEGAEGLKNVLKDMLLYKNKETQAYWPIKKMIDVLSPDFFAYHNRERIQNNLYTRAIWPKNQTVSIKDHPYLGTGEAFKREIRIAPSNIDFMMGYWIYGDRVAFLSSRKESYGYIIESAELTEMLLSQFEMIWRVSTPMQNKGKRPPEKESF